MHGFYELGVYMELQEQVNALQAENNTLKEMVKSLNAEKQTLDQMFGSMQLQLNREIYELRKSLNLIQASQQPAPPPVQAPVQSPVEPPAEPVAELHKDGEVLPLHVEPVEAVNG